MGRFLWNVAIVVVILSLTWFILTPNAHIRYEGLDVRISDTVIKDWVLTELSHIVPDASKPNLYPATKRPIGPILAKVWNAPADESFWKQGVVVDDNPQISTHVRRELESSVGRALGYPVILVESRVKSHVAKSSGVWLHTDRQDRTHRDIHMLVYLSTLHKKDGGACHLFSNEKTNQSPQVSMYIGGGERINEFTKPITAATIGGEWSKGTRCFRSRHKITPKRGRTIIMDCRTAENVHAVTAMHTSKPRHLFEAWFKLIA